MPVSALNEKKALLFDFGGTLDTDGIHWISKDMEIYQHFNINIPEEEFRNAYMESERKIEQTVVPRDFSLRDTLQMQLSNQIDYLSGHSLLTGTDIQKLIEGMTDYCYTDVRKNLLTSYEILSGLKQKYRMGLVSNFCGNLMHICMETNLYHFFQVIVDSTIAGIRKPDPLIFQIAADMMIIKPEDGIVIGDSHANDIKPAKSIGFATIWIRNRGWSEPVETTDADHTISSLSELTEILT